MNSETLIFLLVVWLISPVVLIIICIHLSLSRSKLRDELETLRRSMAMPQTEGGLGKASSSVTPQPTELPLPTESPWAQPVQSLKPSPATVKPVVETAVSNEKKQRFNPVNVILIIGVFFIITAGVLFTGSTWQHLGDPVRIAILASLSVLFFSISELSAKKFKLQRTAAAFFVLGSAFLPVTLFASGYLELFGSWFSAFGAGRFLLYATAAALLGIAALRGTFLYKSMVFAWTALSSLTAVIVCSSWHIWGSAGPLALVLAGYCAALVLTAAFQEKHRADQPGFWNSIILKPLPLFTIVNVCLSAGVTLSGGSQISEISMLIAGGIFSLLFLSRVFTAPDRLFKGMGIFPFSLCLLFTLMRFPFLSEVPAIVAGSALIMLVGMIRVFPAKMRALSSIAVLTALFLGLSFGWQAGLLWSGQLVGAVALLTIAASVRLRSGEKTWRYLHPLLLLLLIWGSVEVYGRSLELTYLLSGALVTALFFGYERLKLRTWLSDTVLLIALAALFVVVNDEYSTLSALLLCLFNFAVILLAARRSLVCRYLVPHYALLLWLGSEPFFDNWLSAAVFWYGALIAVALAVTLLKKRPRAAEARNPFRIAAASYGLIIFSASLAESGNLLFPVITGLLLLFALTEYLTSTNLRKPQLGAVLGLFSAWFWSLGLLLCRMYLLDSRWSLWGAVFGTLLLPALLLLPRIKKNRHQSALLQTYLSLTLHALVSGGILLFLQYPALPLSFAIVCLVVLLPAFLAGFARGNTAFSFVPLLLLFPLLEKISTMTDIKPEILYVLFFAGLQIFSRVFFRRLYQSAGDSIRKIDCFAIISFLPPAVLIARGFESYAGDTARYWQFTGYLLLALSAALLYRRTATKNGNNLALTAAIAALTTAMITQPFFIIPDIMLSEYRLLLPLAAALLLRRFIWKEQQGATGTMAYVYGSAALLYLIAEALALGHSADALILGIGALLLLLISFAIRQKRLFMLSAVTLIFLGVYMSREFWLSIAWWIYLLSAGFLLIGVAIINEAMRTRGSTVLKKIGSLFQDWRW